VRLTLISVARRIPRWVQAAWDEYAGRLGPEFALRLVQVAPAHGVRTRPLQARRAEEAQRIVKRLPRDALVVALDERGASWSTHELAARLQQWRQGGRDVAIVAGGADGLDPALLQQAALRWSLSALTLPHALVRVIVVEQLYRAASINGGHPYHRD